MAKVRNQRRLIGKDTGEYWISYSDMLSSLLLVFMLAVTFSIYQYYHLLETKTKELNAQQAQLDTAQINLAARQQELEGTKVALSGKEEELNAIQIQLDTQKSDLFAAQTALKTKEEEQAALQLQLNTRQDQLTQAQAALKTKEDEQAALQLQLSQQAEALSTQQISLGAMKEALSNQQTQLDELLGVRTSIIKDLSKALTAARITANVDPKTGDILLDSQLMFETGQSEISVAGKQQLQTLIPVYLSVLLRPEYKEHVAEIIIEGHTDSKGSYLFNLQLSQGRAFNVATFCLAMPELTQEQRDLLEKIMTAKGRSFADRIFHPDGSENMQASRRVEIKFRMKDAEMIQRVNEILKGT